MFLDESQERINNLNKASILLEKIKKMKMGSPINKSKEMIELNKIFSKVFNCTTNIEITFESDTIDYGACIYPTKENLKSYINKIIEKDEDYLFKYVTEIRIDVQSVLVELLTPDQIIAVLLHEFGHKIFLERIIDTNAEIINKNRTVVSVLRVISAVAVTAVGATFSALLLVPFLVSLFISVCLFYLFMAITAGIDFEINLNTESLSDSLAVKYGYGKELMEGLEILIKEFNKLSIKKPQYAKSLKVVIDSLQMRKSKILIDLEKTVVSNFRGFKQKFLLDKLRKNK